MGTVLIDVVEEDLRELLLFERVAPVFTFDAAVEDGVAGLHGDGGFPERSFDPEGPGRFQFGAEVEADTDFAGVAIPVAKEGVATAIDATERVGGKELAAGEFFDAGVDAGEQELHQGVAAHFRGAFHAICAGERGRAGCALDVVVKHLTKFVVEEALQFDVAIGGKGAANFVDGGHRGHSLSIFEDYARDAGDGPLSGF